MNAPVNILFTSVGRRVELLRVFRSAYRRLKITGRIVAADMSPLAPALQVADRGYLVPPLTSPDYVAELFRIIEQERITAVFPLIDPDIPVLVEHREHLESSGAHLALVSRPGAEATADKWKTVQFFQELGIPTAQSWLPHELVADQAVYPLFIKPRCGSASQHTFKVEDARQLEFFSRYVPNPIVQEFLSGPEITTDVVCDRAGEVLSVSSRQRIQVRGGEVVVGKTVFDPDIAATSARIARALEAAGPITVQCMLNGGSPKYTEVNARFGGGIPLSVAAGADGPLLLLARLAGVPVEIPRPGAYRQHLHFSRFDDSWFGSFDPRPAGSAPQVVRLRSMNDSGSAPDLPPASSNGRIYLSPPHMSGRERERLLEAFDSNWIAPLGPHVDAFEAEFARATGARAAVALSSGTAALHLALTVLGIGPGDRVATSTLTFAASANAIRYVGATPVFIDSERRTWNLDPELLAEEIEASVRGGQPLKAVLAVDLCGQCADYEPIRKLCRFYEIPLIEDAAEALGATYQGRAAGTLGDVGCFSFNGNKIITTSGGGMLVSDRQDLVDKARFLASQARDPAPHYEHSHIGYNYRMSNLLAAVGRGQLEVLGDRVAARRANYEFYRRELADLPGVEFMPEFERGVSTRWLTCLTIDPGRFGATREDVRLALESENIESRPLWKPMHLQPVYTGSPVRGGSVAEHLFRDGLCLPSGSNLSDADRRRVVEALRTVHDKRAPEARLWHEKTAVEV
ncbi:MAG: aminotransferase class I/II-fold pyridoxal phosphate-dependent enzyme [Rhodopirellula sp.]|nr:aminotransferase class I/II-fold pyridoxal phosphate-dependent enzyme [Rhodopirellula sp.]